MREATVEEVNVTSSTEHVALHCREVLLSQSVYYTNTHVFYQ